MAESWLSAKLLSRLKFDKPLVRFGLVVAATFLFGSAGGAQREGDATSSKPAEPKFSVPGGFYTNAVSIELSAKGKEEVVRYTLDGSEPTSASPEYSSPIKISE